MASAIYNIFFLDLNESWNSKLNHWIIMRFFHVLVWMKSTFANHFFSHFMYPTLLFNWNASKSKRRLHFMCKTCVVTLFLSDMNPLDDSLNAGTVLVTVTSCDLMLLCLTLCALHSCLLLIRRFNIHFMGFLPEKMSARVFGVSR